MLFCDLSSFLFLKLLPWRALMVLGKMSTPFNLGCQRSPDLLAFISDL